MRPQVEATGGGVPVNGEADERRQLQHQLRQQLARLEAALPGSPEWDATKAAVEELQEKVARSDDAAFGDDT